MFEDDLIEQTKFEYKAGKCNSSSDRIEFCKNYLKDHGEKTAQNQVIYQPKPFYRDTKTLTNHVQLDYAYDAMNVTDQTEIKKSYIDLLIKELAFELHEKGLVVIGDETLYHTPKRLHATVEVVVPYPKHNYTYNYTQDYGAINYENV